MIHFFLFFLYKYFASRLMVEMQFLCGDGCCAFKRGIGEGNYGYSVGCWFLVLVLTLASLGGTQFLLMIMFVCLGGLLCSAQLRDLFMEIIIFEKTDEETHFRSVIGIVDGMHRPWAAV